MKRVMVLCGTFLLALCFAVLAQQQPQPQKPSPPTSTTSVDQHLALEGEKRFRANCGRCHMPPHKFPPYVMRSAIRHMRVRAMLTDADMRLITYYLTH